MPQMLKAREHATGESITFNWKGSGAPTREDLQHIFRERRQAKIKIAEQQKTPFSERAIQYITDPKRRKSALGRVLELHETWPRKPAENFAGAVRAAREGTTESPVSDIVHAGLGVAAPPLIAAGMVANPLATSAAVGSMALTYPHLQRGYEAGVEALPEGRIKEIAGHPEARGLAPLAASFGVGGAAGMGARALRPRPAPPTAPVVPPRASPAMPETTLARGPGPEFVKRPPLEPLRPPARLTPEEIVREALKPEEPVPPVRSVPEQPIAPPEVLPPEVVKLVKEAREGKKAVEKQAAEAIKKVKEEAEAPVEAPLDVAGIVKAATEKVEAPKVAAPKVPIKEIEVAALGAKAPELPFAVGDVIKSHAGSYEVTAVGPKLVTYDFTNKAGHLNKSQAMGHEAFSVLARKSKEAPPRIGEKKKSATEMNLKQKLRDAEKDYEAAIEEGNMRGAETIERQIKSMRKRLKSYAPGTRVDMSPEAGAVPGEVLEGILKGVRKAAAYKPPQEIRLRGKAPKKPMEVEAPGAKPTAPITPTEKVIRAVREARPLRGVQETMYARERGIRVAQATRAGEKASGEGGFREELRELGGELPKRQFESLRGKLKQGDIDALFVQAKDVPGFTFFDTINARAGLAKLLDGTVPQKSELALLERAFGPEFTKSVSSARPLWEKMKEGGMQVANIPRSLMASFDLSAPFRQGLFLVRRKQFWGNLGPMIKSFGSEKFYGELQSSIRRRPLYELGEKSKLSFTELTKGLAGREEHFMSYWAERIPIIGKGVRMSEQAYLGFLNKLRADVFDSMVYRAEKLGLNPQKNMDLTKSIANYVNTATGRGSLGRLERVAVELNTFFFSPRLVASRLRLLSPNYYMKLEPFARKEALKDGLALTGAALTVLALAKAGGADVEDDPRNPDFGKIQIGDTRIDIGGGFQQYFRLFAQLLSGQTVSSTSGKVTKLGEGFATRTRADVLGTAAEHKLSPIASFTWSWIRGKTAFGEEFEVPKELAQRFVPMLAQDVYDVAQEDPELLPLSALGAFGFGLQTYPSGAKGIRFSKKRRSRSLRVAAP